MPKHTKQSILALAKVAWRTDCRLREQRDAPDPTQRADRVARRTAIRNRLKEINALLTKDYDPAVCHRNLLDAVRTGSLTALHLARAASTRCFELLAERTALTREDRNIDAYTRRWSIISPIDTLGFGSFVHADADTLDELASKIPTKS